MVREIYEETGLNIIDQLDDIKILSNINKIMMIFGLEVNDDWGENLKKEHHEFETNSYKWININDIYNYNQDDQKNYISLLQIIKFIKKDELNSYLFNDDNMKKTYSDDLSQSSISNISTTYNTTLSPTLSELTVYSSDNEND